MDQAPKREFSMDDNLWWGYLHQSGLVMVKRFYSESVLEDAKELEFVVDMWGPEKCDGRAEALEKAKEYFSIYYDSE